MLVQLLEYTPESAQESQMQGLCWLVFVRSRLEGKMMGAVGQLKHIVHNCLNHSLGQAQESRPLLTPCAMLTSQGGSIL